MLDVDLGAALRIKDGDFLVVDEASAEHGGVASATALAPTTRAAVTATRHHSIELFLARGVGGAGPARRRPIRLISAQQIDPKKTFHL